MRIRLAIPEELVTPEVLEAALEATTIANQNAISRGQLPTLTDAIRKGGVRWKPEPFSDGEHFDLAHQVLGRKWGDCDDLAPWLTAELRDRGENARTRILRTGHKRFHAVTEGEDGKIYDPSRWAGMGRREANVSGVGAAIARPQAMPGQGALCVMPCNGQWWARADLPFEDAHLASHARALTPEHALDRAIAGAIVCGEAIGCGESLDDLREVGALMLTPADHVAAHDSEVGNIFKKILKVAKGPIAAVANPALALGLHTSTNKKLRKLRNAAANAALPGFGGALARGGDSVLRSLTHGKGRRKVPGAIDRPEGTALSLPRFSDDSDRRPTIFYHPAGAIGPVIVRF